MLNCFIGVGRLGRDAELTKTRQGRPMVKLSLASDRYRPKGSASNPYWIACQILGDHATAVAPYLLKGALIGVRGRLASFELPGEPGHQLLRVNVFEVSFLARPTLRSTEPSAAQIEARA
jgi:single-stranded DNA-binding protein